MKESHIIDPGLLLLCSRYMAYLSSFKHEDTTMGIPVHANASFACLRRFETQIYEKMSDLLPFVTI